MLCQFSAPTLLCACWPALPLRSADDAIHLSNVRVGRRGMERRRIPWDKPPVTAAGTKSVEFISTSDNERDPIAAIEGLAPRPLLVVSGSMTAAQCWLPRLAGASSAVALTVPFNNTSQAITELTGLTRALFDLGFLRLDLSETQDVPEVVLFARSDMIRDSKLANSLPLAGRVSMTTLGTNGRFGNQLFQYAFLRLYGLRNSVSVHAPDDWQGRELYQSHLAPLDLPLAQIHFPTFGDEYLALWQMDDPPVDVDFWGYFQEVPPSWVAHRLFLRRMFTPPAGLHNALDSALARWLPGDRAATIIGIHVRRGDYARLCHQYPWFGRSLWTGTAAGSICCGPPSTTRYCLWPPMNRKACYPNWPATDL